MECLCVCVCGTANRARKILGSLDTDGEWVVVVRGALSSLLVLAPFRPSSRVGGFCAVMDAGIAAKTHPSVRAPCVCVCEQTLVPNALGEGCVGMWGRAARGGCFS